MSKILKLPGMCFGFAGGFWDALLLHNRSALASRLRARRYRTTCRIDTGVIIVSPSKFQAGDRCALYHGTYILNSPQGEFSMGHDSHLGAMCFVNAIQGRVSIGSHVAIGPQTRVFSYSNTFEAGKFVTDCKTTADVTIGDNVFIGTGCSILPGTEIGSNVVVGAGAVVNQNLDSNGVYAGVPCRRIKDLNCAPS